jgi:CheY-like chemotaxis protein
MKTARDFGPAAECEPAQSRSRQGTFANLRRSQAMGQRYTVLVVDDDPDVRLLAADFLAMSGYRVLEAADGNHALEIISATHVDVLFTDIRMPRMDGLELARRVERGQPGLRIIFTTGYSSKFPRGREALPWPIIRKPWRGWQLVEQVAKALNQQEPG